MRKLNKKAVESEGMRFNLNNITFLILFLLVLALAIILIFPRIKPQTVNETEYSFAKTLYEMISSG